MSKRADTYEMEGGSQDIEKPKKKQVNFHDNADEIDNIDGYETGDQKKKDSKFNPEKGTTMEFMRAAITNLEDRVTNIDNKINVVEKILQDQNLSIRNQVSRSKENWMAQFWKNWIKRKKKTF